MPKGLSIGVRHDEVDAFETAFDHLVNGITAATAHADDFDGGARAVTSKSKWLI